MNIVSKPFYFTACFILLVFMISGFSTSTFAENQSSPPLFNTQKPKENDGATMKGMSWKTEKPNESKMPKTNKSEETAATDNHEDDDTAELTPEQALWKKYKTLAEGKGTPSAEKEAKNKDAPEADSETLDISEDITTEEDDSPEEKTENEKAAGGLQGILEAYKNSQQNKGKMNTRSFGSID